MLLDFVEFCPQPFKAIGDLHVAGSKVLDLQSLRLCINFSLNLDEICMCMVVIVNTITFIEMPYLNLFIL